MPEAYRCRQMTKDGENDISEQIDLAIENPVKHKELMEKYTV